MTKRQEAAQETRRKLMEAARKIICEQGLAGTQVEEITRMCGVSKGTFYTYFKRKEEVVYALCWGHFEKFRDEALASPAPFLERLSGYMVKFCAYIEQESLKLCQEWVRNTADPDFSGSEYGINKLHFDLESVAALFKDGIKRGEVKPTAPTDLLAHTLVDVMYGEMLCWATSDGEFRFSERTREFCEKFLDSLLKPYLNNDRRK